MKLFTIGHSNHSIEKFVHLIEENGIMTLVDVRTAPYSRYNPQFNKENLGNILSDKQTTVIMCGEEDPSECHRHHLIARHLIAEHPEVDVQHIRGDGIVYSARLILVSVKKPTAEQLSLF